MLLSSIAAPENSDLAEIYDPYPRWITVPENAPGPDDGPAVYLFTNYLWSHEKNLDAARAIRDRHPGALLVHGGPDCPGYPEDSERYLRANPQVDIAVRGEGEVTIVELLRALAPSIRSPEGPDLGALRDVPGLAFLDGEEYVRTGGRDRIQDLNTVPSPYLTGVFDVFGATKQMGMAIIETNRGCPYGCSFCDWGSATNSRIRKLDLDRVLAEFEWCAVHDVPKVFIADANFGIFDRDVEIAQHVVDLRAEHGYPQRFISNYAKNTVKHLKSIISILAGGGVVSEGLLSLQSMDTDTLAAIRRSNIKLDKYEALATEFRDSEMPLFVDLMIGLPGQTVESFTNDLQQCVDREVNAKVHATELLVNSPMNDPSYRSELAVRSSRAPGPTGAGADAARRIAPALVISTASFTRDDYVEMDQVRRSYLLLENLGVARLVSRFVRHETGTREVAFYERMRRDATAAPARWPFLRSAVLSVPATMTPPTSWAFYRDELHRYLVEQIGVADDSALASILTTVHAILPTPGRSLPLRAELAHDVAAWYRGLLAAKHDGHLHDWEPHARRLVELGPSTLTVSDPNDVCDRNLGVGTSLHEYRDWELHSAVERAMPGHHRVI